MNSIGVPCLAISLLVLVACSGPGPSARACNSVALAQPAPENTEGLTDKTGVYTGLVGGKPGFMIIDRNESTAPWVGTLLTQNGVDVEGFIGGGHVTDEPHMAFANGLPHGGGQSYQDGVLQGPHGGAAIMALDWTVGEQIVGYVRRLANSNSLLDFDVKFDAVTHGPQPAGDAIPAGEYDILHGGEDIGDFSVVTPGAGTGAVTWPGASQACPIGVSPGVRAPLTTRNVWRIQFNSDLACSPPLWSTGYAVVSPAGVLSYELIASRQRAAHGRPAPAGEKDMMHIQLRCRP